MPSGSSSAATRDQRRVGSVQCSEAAAYTRSWAGSGGRSSNAASTVVTVPGTWSAQLGQHRRSGSVAVTAIPRAAKARVALPGARTDLQGGANRTARVGQHLVDELVGVAEPVRLVRRCHRPEAPRSLGHAVILHPRRHHRWSRNGFETAYKRPPQPTTQRQQIPSLVEEARQRRHDTTPPKPPPPPPPPLVEEARQRRHETTPPPPPSPRSRDARRTRSSTNDPTPTAGRGGRSATVTRPPHPTPVTTTAGRGGRSRPSRDHPIPTPVTRGLVTSG